MTSTTQAITNKQDPIVLPVTSNEQVRASSFFSRSLTRCVSVVKGAARCGLSVIKNVAVSAGKVFGGMALGNVTLPINAAIMKRVIPIIQKMHRPSEEMMKSICPILAPTDPFNTTCLLAAEEDFSGRAVVKGIQKLASAQLSAEQLLAIIGVVGPVYEECIFRGVVQDLLLQRIPSYVLSKVLPGKETLLQSKTYTVARIVLSSALFAAYHLTSVGVFSDVYVQAQVITTFALGIIFGAIKESPLGLLGSIGNHMSNNIAVVAPTLAAMELKSI